MIQTTNILRKTIIFFLLSTISFMVHAHPHIWITSTEEFVWTDEKLDGCWIEWQFDSYFSADIINAYDTDKNGVFSVQETQSIYSNAFINLRNYYYFTFIRIGTERSNPSMVSYFSARQEKNKIVYRFYVDLSSYYSEEIYLSVYDYTYFCDISYSDVNPVKLNCNSTSLKPKFEIKENRDYPVYYNPLGPATDTTIYYEWKKGLQTYYPKEIRVYYEK